MKRIGDVMNELVTQDTALGRTAARRYALSTDAEMDANEAQAAQFLAWYAKRGGDSEEALYVWARSKDLDAFTFWAVRRVVRMERIANGDAVVTDPDADLPAA